MGLAGLGCVDILGTPVRHGNDGERERRTNAPASRLVGYPGLVILDMPAEFAGELIEDKENFIVQPFIELLERDEYAQTQMIITGASFAGLEGAARRHLTELHISN
jgi:hypothetical protein